MRCPKKEYAGVAQSVVQLIRNQQVVCSSHITSSKWHLRKWVLFVFLSSCGFFSKPSCIGRKNMV